MVKLTAARATLAKRRWRGTAEDGREFGFDLVHALGPGVVFHVEGEAAYCLAQEAEAVLEIPIASPEDGAKIGWSLGNLHFPVQVVANSVRVPDDSAVRQFLDREQIVYAKISAVFLPVVAEASHHHHD